MKFFNSLIVALMAMTTLMSCGSSSKAQEDEQAAPKALVLYYSQSGATEAVAKELQRQLGADIELIEAVQPYDGDYGATIGRCQQEMQEGVVPEIKPLTLDPKDYDVVFLGYPVWFGTYARPIMGLLANQDFEGIKVVPFCTFGSGGLEATTADLKAALPKAEVAEGYGVRNARVAAAPAEIERFLITEGYIEGEVEPLPEYSAPAEVNEEDVARFDAACGDYQFPLGTPIKVSSRQTPTGFDYKYDVESMGMTGEKVPAVIYVVVGNEEGAKPEFTRVVR